MADYYVLDDALNHVPVNHKQWADWVIDRDTRKIDWRKVALSELDDVPGKPNISTVFLGRNHQYNPDGPPILYETMVFWDGHSMDNYCVRYLTREEALSGHDTVCTAVRAIARVEEDHGPLPETEVAP